MKVTIIEHRDTVIPGPGLEPIKVTVYRYKIDEFGPYDYEVEKEKDTKEAFLAEVKRRVELLKAAQEIEI